MGTRGLLGWKVNGEYHGAYNHWDSYPEGLGMEIAQWVFEKLGMDYKDYVVQDEKYMRPEELKYLKGDSSKIRRVLGWKPEYTFETLLDEMIEHWEKIINGTK